MYPSLHCNNNSKPLVLVGSSVNMSKVIDLCGFYNIEITGIIDGDYWNNTDTLSGIPVIDTEVSFNDPVKLQYYKNNYNFFCATNWAPENDAVTLRNKNKRSALIDLLDQYQLNCISLVDPSARISSSAKIGKGVYIDAFVLVETSAEIQDHAHVYAFTGIGHHTTVMRNCVIQRHCSIAGDCVFEPDTYIGTAVKALKTGAVFGRNTFVHEAVYIRRGTVPNEIVKFNGNNMSRIEII